MKFGKQIQSQQLTEWSAHYLNYKVLKKIINSLVKHAPNQPGAEGEEARVRFLQSQKAAFFFRLERELEKINTFYLQKENELRVRLRTLVDKKRVLLLHTGPSRGNPVEPVTRQSTHQATTSLNSLREAFVQYQHDLNKLQKFVELNGTGFRKILKKWDKRSKSSTKELYLSRQIDIQPCFNAQVLTELADIAATNLLEMENLADGYGVVLSDMPESPKLEKPALYLINSSEAALNDIELDLYNAVSQNESTMLLDILSRISQRPSAEDKERLSRVFWHACQGSSTEMTTLLASTGLINFNYCDDINQRSCLHEAAISGKFEVMRLCVEKGVNVNCTDAYGRQPLHYTTMHGYSEPTTFLLAHGADITSVDHDGFHPLIYAIMNGHTACVQILLSKTNVSIEPSDESDHIPLSLACQYGHKDIAIMLLSKGAQTLANSEGLFPLHLAARAGHTDIVQLLTENDRERKWIDMADKYNGWTPVFWAASEGHVACVKVLLKAKCDLSVKDENGATAVYYAAWEGEVECYNLMVEAGGCSDVRTVTRGSDQLSLQGVHKTNIEISNDVNEVEDIQMEEGSDLDKIPSLSLPPPIIPFRIYGHNYLDKKYQVQVTLGHRSNSSTVPIKFYSNTQITSLKLIVSSRPDTGSIPHSVILPLEDEDEAFSFQVDGMENFFLEFEIFPTFGSKVIGKGVALPHHFDRSRNYGNSDTAYSRTGVADRCIVPLFDTHLRLVGEVTFTYTIIKPFSGAQLEIGGRIETYWKSTDLANNSTQTQHDSRPSLLEQSKKGLLIDTQDEASRYAKVGQPSGATPNTVTNTTTVPSLIVASSLSGSYLHVIVQVTRNLVPVIYPSWLLPTDMLEVSVCDVTFEQFRIIGRRMGKLEANINWNTAEPIKLQEALNSEYLSLEDVLQKLPHHIGLNIEIKYPTTSMAARQHSFANISDINAYIDTILHCVYDHALSTPHLPEYFSQSDKDDNASSRHRQLFFSSLNPAVCTAMNWKQPNFAVFFKTFAGFGPNLRRGQKRKEVDMVEEADIKWETSDTISSALGDRRCESLKEAIKFAKSSNLLGIICEATPLVQVPSLITNVKESGLILTTFGEANNDAVYRDIQERFGVDAMLVDGIMTFSNSLALEGL
ncbi:hypothetical protein BZG36_02387 [Bifiguratus adelaidae]|uniref:SPX domain-containing protein n=1 Tax=Bifiguratus adelaidae TaxID=1938954 RepID=A0A261Y141_9FUNG|nr:hypothetical protein BZG36_02387 [Bifiguratus adelaidae]